jgi:hypothetical protein
MTDAAILPFMQESLSQPSSSQASSPPQPKQALRGAIALSGISRIFPGGLVAVD